MYFFLQEASVFVFDKRTADKLHKPRRKETISEMLRHGVRQLERCRHPRLLQVLHLVEETADTLAFATEPVIASLANIFTEVDDKPSQHKDSAETETGGNANVAASHAKDGSMSNNELVHDETTGVSSTELPFLDIELKYGILQVII